MKSQQSPWKIAFKRAEKIEAEGDIAAAISSDDPVFGHSKEKNVANPLAAFVKAYLQRQFSPSICEPDTAISVFKDEAELLQSETNNKDNTTDIFAATPSDNLSRQLCRQWIKHKYLGIGQACVGGISSFGTEPIASTVASVPPCRRMHYVPPNIGALYSDYAFKGLPKSQRKQIMEAINSERKHVAEPIVMETGVDQSPERDIGQSAHIQSLNQELEYATAVGMDMQIEPGTKKKKREHISGEKHKRKKQKNDDCV